MFKTKHVNIAVGVETFENALFEQAWNVFIPDAWLIEPPAGSSYAYRNTPHSMIRALAQFASQKPEFTPDKIAIPYPETFLHPIQQIEVAKAIVNLAAHAKPTMLIVTPSPYMLRALDENLSAKKCAMAFWRAGKDIFESVKGVDDLLL